MCDKKKLLKGQKGSHLFAFWCNLTLSLEQVIKMQAISSQEQGQVGEGPAVHPNTQGT